MQLRLIVAFGEDIYFNATIFDTNLLDMRCELLQILVIFAGSDIDRDEEIDFAHRRTIYEKFSFDKYPECRGEDLLRFTKFYFFFACVITESSIFSVSFPVKVFCWDG